MNKRDYYEVLGVDKGSSKSEIKKAYRSAAMKYHPDKTDGDKESEEKFKEASEAYDVLHDESKRKIYDQFGHAGLKGSGFSGAGGFEDIFSNFGDIFSDIFGGGRARHSGAGSDLRYDLTIELDEAATGTNSVIDFDKKETCTHCAGSGAEKGTSPQTCNTCGGRGEVARQHGFFAVRTTCPSCGGSGQTIKDKCKKCHGVGSEQVRKSLTVKIPAGIESGQHLKLAGEGEPGKRGGPPGDLFVVIHVNQHKIFERSGRDLICQLPISFVQATLGAEIEVPTLLSKATLKIPKGTETHALFKIRGEGMPQLHGGGNGDLIVQVIVQVPKKLTKDMEELLRQYAELSGEKVSEKAEGFFQRFLR